MNFRIALLLALLGCSACGIINGNGYRQLSAAQRAALRPFAPGLLDTVVDHRSAVIEVEVTGRQIARMLRERSYTWIYMWVPYCRDTACRPLAYYSRQADRHRNRGLSLLVVSQIYDPGVLQKHLTRWAYQRPVYVPAARAYGLDMYRARKRFTSELVSAPVAAQMPAHLVFHYDTLVHAGAAMPPNLLDSLVGL